jgi:predicted Zn-ribbon and HTH transcriptional regulator
MGLSNEMRAVEVADDLVGSARDLNEVLTDIEMKDDDLLEEISLLIVTCETCGWWVESDEVDEDGNCVECSE